MRLTKTILILFILWIFGSSAISQNSAITKEVWLQTSVLTGNYYFGAQYRTPINENLSIVFSVSELKITSKTITPGTSSQFSTKYFDFNSIFSIGLEKRNLTKEDFTISTGPYIIFDNYFSSMRIMNPSLPIKLQRYNFFSVNSGIGYGISIKYKIADNFWIGAQSIPSLGIKYTYSGNEGDNTNSFSFASGLTNYAKLSVVYTFNKN